MTRILFIWMVAAIVAQRSLADVITARVTFTNATALKNAAWTNGATITVNSDTRTWTNSVSSAATQIPLTSVNGTNIAQQVQLLLSHARGYSFTGLTPSSDLLTYVDLRGTNGQAMSVSISPSTYAAITYSTNTVGAGYVVRMPITVETPANRTNIANWIVDALAYSTNNSSVSGPAGGDLTGTYPNPTLVTSGVTNGVYGSATNIPVFSVDAKGRITGATNVSFSSGSGTVTSVAMTVPTGFSVSGSPVTTSGTLSVTMTGGISATNISTGSVSNTEFDFLDGVTSGIQSQINGKQATGNYVTALTGDVTASGPGSAAATLANSGVTNGSYGSATTVPTFAVDAKGRITAATNVTISGVSPGGSAGGSLVGTYPNPTLAGGVTAGTYRSVTVGTNGLVSSGTTPTTFSGYGVSDTSANLAAALTDETGTGAAVFSGAPTITNLVVSETVGSSGLTINGATQTASNPALNITQAWDNANTAFTGIKLNVTTTASTNSSLMADLQTNGTNVFAVRKDGALLFLGYTNHSPIMVPVSSTIGGNAGMLAVMDAQTTVAGQIHARYGTFGTTISESTIGVMIDSSAVGASGSGIGMGSDRTLGWHAGTTAPSTSLMNSRDTFLGRDSASVVQIGLDAASVASPQTFKAADGSGTDKAGATLQLRGGQSTGTGRGGSVSTATSLTATTGSSANSYSTRTHQSAKPVDLTESTATLFANIAVATNAIAGATLDCTVYANDGTDYQALHSTLNLAAVNKAGTVTATLTQVDGTTAASSGTLTCTYTAVANGNSVDIKANAVSSLTQTVLRCKWIITALNSDGVGTVTEQ